MRNCRYMIGGGILSVLMLVGVSVTLADVTDSIQGEKLDASLLGQPVIESMEAVEQRQAEKFESRYKYGDGHGQWAIPSPRATFYPRSGQHYVVNKRGDTRMGIGFPEVVDVHGAYFMGQAGKGVWTTGVRVIGFLDGEEVARTAWFRDIDDVGTWFPMNLRAVDRIVIEAEPVVQGAGWYGMDDLTFSSHSDTPVPASEITVIDFEDTSYRQKLTGSSYRGLTWETGTGQFDKSRYISNPPVPEKSEPAPKNAPREPEPVLRGATLPTLDHDFRALRFGDLNQFAWPPDSHGAVGADHFVTTVNVGYAVYDKDTGIRRTWSSLDTFFTGMSNGGGDPRVIWDPDSERWIAIATGFSNDDRLWIAVSKTADPRLSWFKTSILTSVGADAGRWPDYPTLGVDENGIYITTAMFPDSFGGVTTTVFALEKAPLVADPPSLGNVYAYRGLPHNGALQPVVAYGDMGGAYFIERTGSTQLQLRQLTPDLATLNTVGTVSIPFHSSPDDAPALGSSTNVDTIGTRLMMAMARADYPAGTTHGRVWTCHTVDYFGQAACRWYEIDPVDLTLEQSGTVVDDSLHYYFPSVAVNEHGDMVMGFSGSSPSEYIGAYYTGRRGTDPAGAMAEPVRYEAGLDPYTRLDPWGRNRWGDYSHTSLDPDDPMTFYTIQAYAYASDSTDGDRWATRVALVSFDPLFTIGDMNCDGVIDFGDINPFVAALSGQIAYETQYPDCEWLNADVNGDDVVDFDDINPFVALLSGS